MKINHYIILIMIYLLSSTSTIEAQNQPDTCMSQQLDSTIKSYIKDYRIKRGLRNEDTIVFLPNFIMVYFHSKKNSNYFTIFQSPWPVYIFFNKEESMKNSLKFLLFFLDDQPVYLISQKSVEKFDLFNFCAVNMDLASKNIDVPLNMYDGSYYPITYEYFTLNDNVRINKLLKPILNFRPGMQEYENNIKRKEKFRLK